MLLLSLLTSTAAFQLEARQAKTAQTPLQEVRAKAEAGDADYQAELGVRYMDGEGVAKDQVEAVKWYRKAAEQGDTGGQAFLAICYYYGDGVPKDYAEAVKWDRKAAEQNSSPSQYRLGVALWAGDGVEMDLVEGYKWLLLAAKQGDDDAKRKMVELAKDLTPGQMAEAQKRANDFKPR
jgi:uncharacterized protein